MDIQQLHHRHHYHHHKHHKHQRHQHHRCQHHHDHNSLVCRRVWQLRSVQTKLLHSCPSYTSTSHRPHHDDDDGDHDDHGDGVDDVFFCISHKLHFQQMGKVCQGFRPVSVNISLFHKIMMFLRSKV